MSRQIFKIKNPTGFGTQFYFYQTYAVSEIDLILDRGNERIGIKIKCSASTTPKDWANLKGAINQKIIDRGYLVNFENRIFVKIVLNNPRRTVKNILMHRSCHSKSKLDN